MKGQKSNQTVCVSRRTGNRTNRSSAWADELAKEQTTNTFRKTSCIYSSHSYRSIETREGIKKIKKNRGNLRIIRRESEQENFIIINIRPVSLRDSKERKIQIVFFFEKQNSSNQREFFFGNRSTKSVQQRKSPSHEQTYSIHFHRQWSNHPWRNNFTMAANNPSIKIPTFHGESG